MLLSRKCTEGVWLVHEGAKQELLECRVAFPIPRRKLCFRRQLRTEKVKIKCRGMRARIADREAGRQGGREVGRQADTDTDTHTHTHTAHTRTPTPTHTHTRTHTHVSAVQQSGGKEQRGLHSLSRATRSAPYTAVQVFKTAMDRVNVLLGQRQ